MVLSRQTRNKLIDLDNLRRIIKFYRQRGDKQGAEKFERFRRKEVEEIKSDIIADNVQKRDSQTEE